MSDSALFNNIIQLNVVYWIYSVYRQQWLQYIETDYEGDNWSFMFNVT